MTPKLFMRDASGHAANSARRKASGVTRAL
jgi:hypothetical protein